MILRQKTCIPINGYWDGGAKSTFDWSIDRSFEDGKSRVGSWQANYWFEVKTGKSEKATLGNARRSLQNRRTAIKSTFEYIDEEN